MRLRLEFHDHKSHKFWEGQVEDGTLTTIWGRVGTAGQSKSWTFDSQSAAEAELQKKARAKRKKGYEDAPSLGTSEPTESAKAAGAKPASNAPKKNENVPKSAPKKKADTQVTPEVFPDVEAERLSGELINLSDYPEVFAFSHDGRTLAAHGISCVHLVDVPQRTWSATHESKDARFMLFTEHGLFVGRRTIQLIDPATGKKVRAFKGHKAPPNVLATSADGSMLWSGGGSFIDTHDRMVRAYDVTTGELRYTVKPARGAGAVDIAVNDGVVAVAAEDGSVVTFSADGGAPLEKLSLAPPIVNGNPMGGIAACGDGFVAAAAVGGDCVITWLGRDLTIEAVRVIAGEAESVQVHHPTVSSGHIVIPTTAKADVTVTLIDVATRELVSCHILDGLDDWRCSVVSADGMVAWKSYEGVFIARLLGVAEDVPSKRQEPTSSREADEHPVEAPKNPAVVSGTMTGGGPERRSAFSGDFTTTPAVRWARADYRAGASEFGGSVVVGDGIAVGSSGDWLVAHDADSGETRWTAQLPIDITSGFSIAHGAVLMSTRKGVHAYDAGTGEPLWTARVQGAAGAPLVVDDTVVIGGRKGLYARSLAKNGRKAWTYSVKDRVAGAPAHADGIAFVYADTQLLAIDIASRELAWSVPARAPLGNGIGPMVCGDLVLYFEQAHLLAAANRRTGQQLWTTEVGYMLSDRSWSCTDDALFVRDDEGWLRAYDVLTGEPTWRSKANRRAPYHIGSAGPVVVGRTVVSVTVEDTMAISGQCFLSGVDADSGEVRWDVGESMVQAAIAAEQTETGSTFSGGWSWHCTPFVADGILYAQTDAGIVALQ